MTARERIEQEIATLQARIEGLSYAMQFLGDGQTSTPTPNVGPSPKNEPSPPNGYGQSTQRQPKSGTKTEMIRAQAARLLFAQGPLRTKVLCDLINETSSHIGLALQHPWFRKQPGGKFTPWELTDAGRVAASAL